VRRLLLFVIILALLLIAADRGLAFAAERMVADRIEESQNLPSAPDVTVRGIPFLTQALAGHYDRVDISIADLPAGEGLRLSTLDATLHGVQAPPLEILQGKLQQVPVDSGDIVAAVTFAQLQTAAAQTAVGKQLNLRITAAGADRVTVASRIDTGAGAADVSGQARVVVTDGRVSLAVLAETLTGVPAVLRDQIASSLQELTLAVPALPFGIKAQSVIVRTDGIVLRGHADNLLLSR
jgi:hypothetical protein